MISNSHHSPDWGIMKLLGPGGSGGGPVGGSVKNVLIVVGWLLSVRLLWLVGWLLMLRFAA